MRRVLLPVLAVPAMVLGSAGCGANAVTADDVEMQISDQLEEQVGQQPDDVSCPDDLPAEEGESIRCELTAGEDTLGVTATVTSVEGDTVNFDIQVDEVPGTGSGG